MPYSYIFFNHNPYKLALFPLGCGDLMVAQHKDQRIGVFVDVQNMYYSARNLYNAKVNFVEILKKAVSNRKLIRAIAYVIKSEDGEESSFFDALGKIGYEVKSKNLQIFYGGHKKGDWDVGIAMDIMRLASKLDVIVLVSGDGDFSDLLEHASALGCRTEVLAFGKSASIKLKDGADLFIDLDKSSKKMLMSQYKKRTNTKTQKSSKDV